MSLTPTAPRVASPRRVRHQARDVLVMMAFSAACSTGLAVALLVLTRLSGAGR
jgi:hypothetical protein